LQIILIFIILIKLSKKNKPSSTDENQEQLYQKYTRSRILWIKGAGVLREMIGLLPFLGIFGTVLGLLNTLETFRPGSVVEIELVIKQFAPALTSTISALIGTIINMLLFNLVLLPPIMEYENVSGEIQIINKNDKPLSDNKKEDTTK